MSDEHKDHFAQALERMAEDSLKDAEHASPGAASDLANKAAHMLRTAAHLRGPGPEGGSNAKDAREAKDQVGRGDIGGGLASQKDAGNSARDPERSSEPAETRRQPDARSGPVDRANEAARHLRSPDSAPERAVERGRPPKSRAQTSQADGQRNDAQPVKDNTAKSPYGAKGIDRTERLKASDPQDGSGIEPETSRATTDDRPANRVRPTDGGGGATSSSHATDGQPLNSPRPPSHGADQAPRPEKSPLTEAREKLGPPQTARESRNLVGATRRDPIQNRDASTSPADNSVITDDQAGSGSAEFQLFNYADRLRQDDKGLKLAFVFANDRYGKAGKQFLREAYPEHIIINAKSLEQLTKRGAAAVVAEARKSNSPVRISEIVILAHANGEGGIKIPLTDYDALSNGRSREIKRPITPWSLSALGNEMRAGQHTDFAQTRDVLIGAIDERSRVVIRGCEFGLSDHGLRAMNMFFGGEAKVYAPTSTQGFEASPMRRGGEIALYDSLAAQGHLPSDVSPEQKLRVIQSIAARNGGTVPRQFFIESGGGLYEAYKDLSVTQRLGPAAEQFKTRSAVPDPTLKSHLESMSRDKLIARARAIQSDYRPESAPLLDAMARAWSARRPGEPASATAHIDPGDPLGGLPSAFAIPPGDRPKELMDPWRSSDDAGAVPTPGRDPLISGDLKFSAPSKDKREKAERDFNERRVNDLVTRGVPERPAPLERPWSANKGQVEELPNRGLRVWNFSVGDAVLRTEFEGSLRAFADRAKENADSIVVVVGHASTPGGETANARVSLARAQAVGDELVRLGVSSGRIVIAGQGEREPLAPDEMSGKIDAKSAAQNRRVDIRFEPTGTAAQDAFSQALKESVRGEKSVSDQLSSLKPDMPDAFKDPWNWAGIISDVLGLVGEAAPKLGPFGLVSPIIDLRQHVKEIGRLKESYRREGQAVGLSIGLGAARILASEGKLDRNVGGDDLGRVLQRPDVTKYYLGHHNEWIAYAGTGQGEFGNHRISDVSTLSWEKRSSAVRQGLARAASLVNAVLRGAEGKYRDRLAASGMTPAEVEHMYNSSVGRLRADCVATLEVRAAQDLKSRR